MKFDDVIVLSRWRISTHAARHKEANRVNASSRHFAAVIARIYNMKYKRHDKYGAMCGTGGAVINSRGNDDSSTIINTTHSINKSFPTRAQSSQITHASCGVDTPRRGRHVFLGRQKWLLAPSSTTRRWE